MKHTYQYRFYPNTKQNEELSYWLRVCQYWYNKQLGERFNWYEGNRNYVLPVGIWHSDYMFNVNIRNSLITAQKKLDKLLSEDELDQDKINEQLEKIDKLKQKKFLDFQVSNIEKCDLSCTFTYSELANRPNFHSQATQLPGIKKDFIFTKGTKELLDFKRVDSTILQQVSKRVESSFTRYVVGDSNGKRSGKPRFKSKARFRTMTFATANNDWISLIRKKWIYIKLPKIGVVKVRYHRSIPEGSSIKQISLSKKNDGWYINLMLEDKTIPVIDPKNIEETWENSIGMDAVLKDDIYLATSENSTYPSLKPYRKAQEKLTKLQSIKDKLKKGTKTNRNLAKRLARLHQQIARQRKDHRYKIANHLVRSGKKVFYVEDPTILSNLQSRNKAKKDEDGKFLPNGQSAKSGLNKSWKDAAFSSFVQTLERIAGKAGAKVIKVKPAYTSMVLSYRDEIVFDSINVRTYVDPQGFEVDRDINSGLNIKKKGLGIFPSISKKKKVKTKSPDISILKKIVDIFSDSTTTSYIFNKDGKLTV